VRGESTVPEHRSPRERVAHSPTCCRSCGDLAIPRPGFRSWPAPTLPEESPSPVASARQSPADLSDRRQSTSDVEQKKGRNGAGKDTRPRDREREGGRGGGRETTKSRKKRRSHSSDQEVDVSRCAQTFPRPHKCHPRSGWRWFSAFAAGMSGTTRVLAHATEFSGLAPEERVEGAQLTVRRRNHHCCGQIILHLLLLQPKMRIEAAIVAHSHSCKMA